LLHSGPAMVLQRPGASGVRAISSACVVVIAVF
jgi:hypothetical protein